MLKWSSRATSAPRRRSYRCCSRSGCAAAREEVDQEAERVLDPDDLAEPADGPRGQPLGPAAERRVVRLRLRQVGVGPDPEPQRPGRRRGPDRRIRLWCVSSSYPRRYSAAASESVTTNPSRSTQNRRASSSDVTISVAYADRTMSGPEAGVIHQLTLQTRHVRLAERQVHDPGLGVEVDGVLPALPAEPARLDAAERRPQVPHVMRVDPGHPDSTAAATRCARFRSMSPQVGREPVPGRVGQHHRLRLGVERRHAHHRAEDLLLEDPHRRRHVREHGRGQEVPAVQAGRPRPARHQPGALPHPSRT